MTRLPEPRRYLLGGDPPAWVVPARVAALLDRTVLDEFRRKNRGLDTQLDEVLQACHMAALLFREHNPISNSGSSEVPDDIDVSGSPRERVGCVEAGSRLGLTRRQIVNIADRLDGQKIAGRWQFDSDAVDDELARRRQMKETA